MQYLVARRALGPLGLSLMSACAGQRTADRGIGGTGGIADRGIGGTGADRLDLVDHRRRRGDRHNRRGILASRPLRHAARSGIHLWIGRRLRRVHPIMQLTG